MSQGHQHALLLVEDNPETREALEAVLSVQGYEVRIAREGAEALRHLRAGYEPCAILLDLVMPGSSGFDFRAEQLKVPAFARIPVVVLSGHHDVQGAAAQLGIRDFLRKPPDLNDLLAVVERGCRRA